MIGGDFQISSSMFLDFDVEDKIRDLQFEHGRLLDSGRSAIRGAIFLALKNATVKNAWVPFYSCPSMIKPFHDAGVDVHYYGMGYDLAEPSGLPEKLDNSIFLFTHYFGKYNRRIVSYLEAARTSNTTVIEDVVQSCMNPNQGKVGDYVVNSLRKFLPIPDGAILVGPQVNEIELQPPDEKFISLSLIAKIIRADAAESDIRHLAYKEEAEQILNKSQNLRRISNFSEYFLRKFDLAKIHTVRRQNWQFLSECFKSDRLTKTGIKPLYNNITVSEIPLLFPVVVDMSQRDAILAELRSKNVFCPVHWRLDRPEQNWLLPDYHLSQSLFSIPVDQRMSTSSLEHLVDMLETTVC